MLQPAYTLSYRTPNGDSATATVEFSPDSAGTLEGKIRGAIWGLELPVSVQEDGDELVLHTIDSPIPLHFLLHRKDDGFTGGYGTPKVSRSAELRPAH